MQKLLIIAGSVLIVIGLLWHFLAKIPFLGRLPGDIVIRKENFTFYFPLATSLLLSAALSLVFWFFSRRS